jgi:hypothetical protein
LNRGTLLTYLVLPPDELGLPEPEPLLPGLEPDPVLPPVVPEPELPPLVEPLVLPVPASLPGVVPPAAMPASYSERLSLPSLSASSCFHCLPKVRSFLASSFEITPSPFLSSDSNETAAPLELEPVVPVPGAPEPVELEPDEPVEPEPDAPESVDPEEPVEPALDPELEPEEPGDDWLCATAALANKHAKMMDKLLSFMI